MKLWLSGLALLAVAGTAQAENYRIVQSPSQKLDIWIDDIKDKTPQSWCKQDVSLRIVANGNKEVSILDSFMPRLGALLENQCGKLQQLAWTLNDPAGETLAQGTASKNKEWAVAVAQPQVAAAASDALVPPAVNPETLSVAADRTPWQEFTLQNGCHLRTFWQGGATAPALFIPASGTANCENGGWLSGHTVVTQASNSGQQDTPVTYIHGFPVTGLSDSVNADDVLITSVNKERMVFSTKGSEQSWMILPYDSALNSWKNEGTVVVQVSQALASDDVQLQARLQAVKQIWTPWLAPNTSLNIVLVDALRPQLRDPAVGAWRAAN